MAIARAETIENASGDTASIIRAEGQETLNLPSSEFLSDATFVRTGADLVLTLENGEQTIVQNYFNQDPQPVLTSADGHALSPSLVHAFLQSAPTYAALDSANDASPIGQIDRVQGEAHITHADGSRQTISEGTKIFQGDIIETSGTGAVNIAFQDQSTLAIGKNARLALDEFVYNPSDNSGTTHVSFLRGLFLFTSGLIAGNDPDDVKIETPVGSIGIRGTIIAAEILPGGLSRISVLEGAIVVRNDHGEKTLSSQYETVSVGALSDPITSLGILSPDSIEHRFESLKDVSPSIFNMLEDLSKTPSDQSAKEADDHSYASDSLHTSYDSPASINLVSFGMGQHTGGLPSQSIITGKNSYLSLIDYTDQGSISILDTASSLKTPSINTGLETSHTDSSSDYASSAATSASTTADNNPALQQPNLEEYAEIDNNNNLVVDGADAITPINGGVGIDTLSVVNDVDFTHLGEGELRSIEYLNFTSASQTITLSLQNILNLLSTSDDGILRIGTNSTGNILNLDDLNPATNASDFVGQPADQIKIWLSTGQDVTSVDVEPSLGNYTATLTYNNIPYQLLIDSDITVNVT